MRYHAPSCPQARAQTRSALHIRLTKPGWGVRFRAATRPHLRRSQRHAQPGGQWARTSPLGVLSPRRTARRRRRLARLGGRPPPRYHKGRRMRWCTLWSRAISAQPRRPASPLHPFRLRPPRSESSCHHSRDGALSVRKRTHTHTGEAKLAPYRACRASDEDLHWVLHLKTPNSVTSFSDYITEHPPLPRLLPSCLALSRCFHPTDFPTD